MSRSIPFAAIGFLLCASVAQAQIPTNDTCAGAITIDCGNFSFETNTTLANNDYDQLSNCTGFDSSGPDIVYVLDIPAGGSLGVTLDTLPPNGSGHDGSLYLILDCSNPSVNVLACSDECLAAEAFLYTNLTESSQTAFLIVDGFNEPGGCGTPSGTALLSGNLDCPVAVEQATWGRVKTHYRD